MSLHVGETFGDYEVVSILGAGGMGQVFQVEHRLTKRRDAAKILSIDRATEVQMQRFERELAVQARLNHPNIAVVHNALHADGRLILVMEFVEGHTLEALLQKGQIPVDTGVKYIRQTLAALQYAHEHGVVHRDVNPANLIITSDGIVKLTDFGLAKCFNDSQLTNYGDLVGSVCYLAPEQAKGVVVPDPRSDLFAVGVILYEILTGKKPFGDNRLVSLLTDSEEAPSLPTKIDSGLRPEWNEIILKALAHNPNRRYQSAADFLKALGSIVNGSASSFTDIGRVVKAISTSTWLSFAVACLSPLAVVAAITLRHPLVPAPQARTFYIQPPKEAFTKPAVALSRKTPRPKRETQGTGVSKQAREPRPATALNVAPEPVPKEAIPSDQNVATEQSWRAGPTSSNEPPPKKKFWWRLNPFKKRRAEVVDDRDR